MFAATHERLMPVLVLLLGGALTVLYWLGVIDEAVAGMLFAVLGIAAACVYAVAAMLESAPSRGAGAIAVLLGVASFAAAFAPVLSTLLPGTPAAHGELAQAGDSLPLPAAAHGAIRLLIHGKLAGSGPTSTELTFDVGRSHVKGELSRTQARARLGRRGTTTVLREHGSDYIEVDAERDAERVTLAGMNGELLGPLRVDVFSDPLPLRADAALVATLLLLAALFMASTGTPAGSLSALAWALLFGALVHYTATPETAVGPELGALMASGFAGVLLAHVLLAATRGATAAVRRPRE